MVGKTAVHPHQEKYPELYKYVLLKHTFGVPSFGKENRFAHGLEFLNYSMSSQYGDVRRPHLAVTECLDW